MAVIGRNYHPPIHKYVFLALEILCWALLLAAWIGVCVDLAQHSECFISRHIRACNTLYVALAFVVFDWILFTATMAIVVPKLLRADDSTAQTQ
jgi:hypothetical protein